MGRALTARDAARIRELRVERREGRRQKEGESPGVESTRRASPRGWLL